MRVVVVTVFALGAFVLSAGAQPPNTEDPKAEELKAKLGRTIIPHVEFDGVGLREAIAVLRRRSIELDPDGEGVNFVVHTAEEVPEVTLELSNVSLAVVVRMLTLLTATEYEIDENVLIIKRAASAQRDHARSDLDRRGTE